MNEGENKNQQNVTSSFTEHQRDLDKAKNEGKDQRRAGDKKANVTQKTDVSAKKTGGGGKQVSPGG